MRDLRVLHAEDDPDDAELVLRALRGGNGRVECVRVASAGEMRRALAEQGPFDVVLSDHVMPGFSSHEALELVAELAADVPFIVVSGKIGEEDAVELIRHGAVDYVWKDRLGRLRSSVDRALADRAERALRKETEARFRLAVNNQLDAFAIFRAVRGNDGAIVDLAFDFVNHSACELFGAQPAELLGHGLLETMPDLRDRDVIAACRRVVDTGEPLIRDDVEYADPDHAGGASVPRFYDLRVARHDDGLVIGCRDVTDRHQARERADAVSQMYATLSRVNEAIVAAPDRPSLYSAVCQAVVTHAGVVMAWIGEADEGTGRVGVAARAGEGTDFLDGIDVSMLDVAVGRGPTGRALREGVHVIAQDLAHDAAIAPWRSQVLAHGFAASAAFPLRCGERVVGAMMLYADRPAFFHDEQVALLDQLASDVSFALEALDRDARRRVAESDLARTASLLSEGENVAGFGCWEWDPAEDSLSWSDGFAVLLGLPGDATGWNALVQALDADSLALLRPPGADEMVARLRAGESVAAEREVCVNGEPRVLAVAARPMLDTAGHLARVVGTVQDVTQRRRAEEELWLRARLLDAVRAGVVATGMDGRVVFWNAFAEQLYGWSQAEAVGRPIQELGLRPERRLDDHIAEVAERSAWEGTVEVTRKDGSRFPALVKDIVFRDEDGRPQGIIGVAVDISEQVASERSLREARDFLDSVTASMGEGLLTLNSHGRINYVNRAAVDLLGWEADDLHGSDAAETVLAGAEEQSQVLLREPTREATVRIQNESLVRRDGSRLPVALTAAPMKGVEPGWVVVFSDDTERRQEHDRLEHEIEALGWVGRIRSAIEHDDLVLFAQPIVDIATGEVRQHELLVRMRDDDGSIIEPGAFLPTAEEFGLITDIDRWVVERGVEIAKQGHPVEMNLSAASLGDREMASWLEEIVRSSGIDPAFLVFEVTETALLTDPAAGEWLAYRIAALGCRLALDDFGTGYGGFTYLKRLHVDTLKIDIEFVRDLLTNKASRNVVKAVVNLATGFELTTVAEGVEDEQTLRALAEIGVDMAQGFHFARPMPVSEVFGLEPADEPPSPVNHASRRGRITDDAAA